MMISECERVQRTVSSQLRVLRAMIPNTLIAEPYNPIQKVIHFPQSNSRRPLFSTLLQGVMVRLMLVLAPVMCIVSGVAASSLLSLHVKDIEPKVEKHDVKKKRHESNLVFRSEVR